MALLGRDLNQKYLPFVKSGERRNLTTWRINFVYIKGDKFNPKGKAVYTQYLPSTSKHINC